MQDEHLTANFFNTIQHRTYTYTVLHCAIQDVQAEHLAALRLCALAEGREEETIGAIEDMLLRDMQTVRCPVAAWGDAKPHGLTSATAAVWVRICEDVPARARGVGLFGAPGATYKGAHYKWY